MGILRRNRLECYHAFSLFIQIDIRGCHLIIYEETIAEFFENRVVKGFVILFVSETVVRTF